MFQPLELIKEYRTLARGEARLSGIRNAINQADLAKDYSYMLYFRYEYAESCSEYEDGLMLHIYLVFPEMLKIFEEHPDIEMPDYCFLSAVKVVKRIFMYVVNCADYFYQIPLSDMEQYFKKFKEFCLQYGYALDDYYMAYTRFFRAIDKEKALRSFEEYRKCIRAMHMENAYTIDFEFEMEYYYDNIEEALRIGKPLLEGKYHNDELLFYEYGRLLDYYILQEKNIEEAGYYYERMEKVRKKLRKPPLFFRETVTYLVLTNLDKAWNLYKKEVSRRAGSTIPSSNFDFAVTSAIMLKSIEKRGREQVHIRFPKKLSCYRDDNCYQTKELGEYFDREARDLAGKFDARNGNKEFLNEYKNYMAAANL